MIQAKKIQFQYNDIVHALLYYLVKHEVRILSLLFYMTIEAEKSRSLMKKYLSFSFWAI